MKNWIRTLTRDVMWAFGFVPAAQLEQDRQHYQSTRKLMEVATDDMRAKLLIKIATMEQQLDILSQKLKKRNASLNRTSVKLSYYKKQYLKYRFGETQPQ